MTTEADATVIPTNFPEPEVSKSLVHERRMAVVQLVHTATSAHTPKLLADRWAAHRALYTSDSAALNALELYLKEVRMMITGQIEIAQSMEQPA